MKCYILAPFILVLLLGACSADQPELEAVTASPTVQAVALGDIQSTATPLPTTAPLPTLASSTPLPTTVPVDESVVTAEPAALTPSPSPTGEPDPVQVISGQTAEGAFFLGAPDAPITVIDYSDFL
jgi:hypothetical protein